MSNKLPVTFELQPLEQLPIQMLPGAKKKARRSLSEAQAFAKFGVHSLRVKASVIAALGKEASDAGIKHLGHGKVIVASHHAEEAISKLGEIVDKLSAEEKPNFELIVELLRLQREFNSQLIMTGQIHLNVGKSVSENGAGPHLTVPLPAGSPVMIVSNPKEMQ